MQFAPTIISGEWGSGETGKPGDLSATFQSAHLTLRRTDVINVFKEADDHIRP